MNNTNDLYNRWLAQPDLDDAVKAELVSIAGDSDAVTDRFYRDLEFGTGGLRGVIGAGTNRMNLYTVRKATQGLADYLNASGLPKKVAIAHDSRHNGALFARETARVLAANGITACMYPRLEPTPALSWAVRYLGCGAGVCVTASHNPAKYNGYKVYGADGCQITLESAEKILAAIEKIDCFDDVRLADFDAAAAAGRIVTIDEKCLDDFVQAVYDQRVGDGAGIDALKLVYTPLNGTGLVPVTTVLARAGVSDVTVVPEQEQPDGNFPTCPYPNPEIREAMQKGIDLCEQVHPDLLLATDPDAARVGVAVLTTIHSSSSEGTYRRMVSLCKRAVDTPDDTLMGYVTEAYPIVVYCRQLENKERRITNISECEILPDGSRRLHKLYEYNITENRLEGDRFIIEGHHQKCEEMSESLQRRFIENGMPRGELEQFIQRKEETA